MKIAIIIIGALLITSCKYTLEIEQCVNRNDEYWYNQRTDPWDNIEAGDDILGVYINGEKTLSRIGQRREGEGPYYNVVESYFFEDDLVIFTKFYKSSFWEGNFKILVPKEELGRGKNIKAKIVRDGPPKYTKDTLTRASICFDSVYAINDYTHLVGRFEFEGTICDTIKVVGENGVFHDKTRNCFFPRSFYNDEDEGKPILE